MEFKNKNILIIGGSSDIGLALINDLILLQSNIYFTCKTRDRIEEVTPKIKAKRVIILLDCKKSSGAPFKETSSFTSVLVSLDGKIFPKPIFLSLPPV